MSDNPNPQTKDQMFLNSSLVVTQNANSYGGYYNENGVHNYDYLFLVNLASLTLSGDITEIFTNATFEQDQTNADNVNVNLTLQPSSTYTSWGTHFNNQNLLTISLGKSTLGFTTLNPTAKQTIGDRLLEVVAHKLFGNGQARAAIDNDLEFYLHDAAIWDHLSTALANAQLANDVFNQYVASGRYSNEANYYGSANTSNANDNNTFVKFNFSGLTFDYPMYLSGALGLSDSLTTTEKEQLNNGPAVGGTQLNSGTYNIPILIRFFSSV